MHIAGAAPGGLAHSIDRSSMNYTIADLLKTLLALVLFVPFALSPGYTVGWLSNALEFRERKFREKLLIAIPLSTAIVPEFIYLCGRFVSLAAVWAGLGIAFATCVVLIIGDVHRETRPFAGMRPALLVAAAWAALGLISTVDFQWGDRLYVAASSYDYATRGPIVASIARTGVQPANPFYFPEHAVTLRYHYFWLLPCGLVTALTHARISPLHAIMASALWTGFALMALIVAFVRYFRNTAGPPSRSRTWTALGLMWVIGFDIIPWLIVRSFGVWLFAIGKWNEEIDGWFVSLVWVPHDVAAVVTCLIGFLVLWRATARERPFGLGGTLLAGFAFAGSVGTAIYVALVFAAALALLSLIALGKKWWKDLTGLAISGFLATLLATPYLLSLSASGGASTGPGKALLVPAVRKFLLLDPIVYTVAPRFPLPLFDLAALPLNYFLELGFLFIVGVIQLRRYLHRKAPLGRKEWAEISLLAVPVLICSFIRSSAVENNDLGWRGFLIPQFFLLLWSVDYVRAALRLIRHKKAAGKPLLRMRNRVLATLSIGLAGTVMAVFIHRAFAPSFDLGWNHDKSWSYRYQVSGKRVFALRRAYEWLDRNLPPGSIVLHGPDPPDFNFGLYSIQPTALADLNCTMFGGPADQCAATVAAIQPVFKTQNAAPPPDLQSVCSAYSAKAIAVKDLDPVWADRESWVWKTQPVFTNAFARIFACPAPH